MKFNLNHRVVPAILALFVLGSVASVQAATNTGNMTVTANVATACTVSATSMAFGTVIPGIVSGATATVTANCTNGTSYTLDLGDGLNHTVDGGGGGLYRRQMASGTYRLPYVVSVSSTLTPEIGASDPSALNNLQTSIDGTGEEQDYIIYGQIKAAETETQEPGAYADTVVITINY